jgi:hypothetical protein
MTGAAAAAARVTGNPGINNTAWLFFILAAAFLFYVTTRGDLPKWLGLFGLGKSAAPAAPSPGATGTPSAARGLPSLPGLPPLAGGQGGMSGGVEQGTWDYPQPIGGTAAPQDATW